MTQKFLFLFFFIMVYGSLLAGDKDLGSFSGVILDQKTNLPIEGASISIVDEKIGTSSDAQGHFLINNIIDGKHLIEISHLGYSTIVEYIEFSGEIKKDFYLSATIVENNTVVVTGVSRATQLKNIPFQVSVVRRQEMLQSSGMNIMDVVTNKAGVASIATGPAISKPLIRGLGYNRVLTINDGVRQEEQQWGDEHGIEIDDANLSKIEILKGPASLIYGSDAMAGVINIVSNIPVPDNCIKMNFGSNVQSNNHLRMVNGNIGGNKKRWNWNAYGTMKAAGDYKNKYDGYVYNSKFINRNIGGYIGYNGSRGYSHLLISQYYLKAGLTEGLRDSMGNFVKELPGGQSEAATEGDFLSTDAQIPFQKISHYKIASDNSIKLGDNRLTINVGWQQNKRKEFGNIENLDETALHLDMQTITYATQFHFKEKNGWHHTLGINGMSQLNKNFGIEQLIPDYHLFDAGGFVFSKKEINQMQISGGVRYDLRNVRVDTLRSGNSFKGIPFKRMFSNFSGSIGIAYPVTKNIQLKLNAARAFRAPSISELASNGAHEGTIRYEYGDKNLKSEISNQYDAAIEWNREHYSINIAGYFNQFNNFIFYKKLQTTDGTDSIVEENGSLLTAFQFDQQKTNLRGLEITLDFHPHPLDWLHIENSFSFVRGTFQKPIEGCSNLPFIPAPKWYTECRADIKNTNANFKNTYFKISVENTFSQNNPFTAYHTETATPGYTLINAGLGTEIFNKKNIQVFGVYFTASNITDVSYQSHLSRLKYASTNLLTGRSGIYNVGRNFSLKINVPLSFKI